MSIFVSDEVISLGGGLDDPKIRLTKGDSTPERISQGETLTSRCYLEEEEEEENYQFSWVARMGDEDRVLAMGQDLTLPNVNADTFRVPIFCLAENLDDGRIFGKQMAIEYRKAMHDNFCATLS